MEVTSKTPEVAVGVGDEGDVVELSLGLSLGCRRSGNKKMSSMINSAILPHGTGNFDGVDAGDINSVQKSGGVSLQNEDSVREKMDLVRKGDACTLQRHRKKREEKRQKVVETKVTDDRVESNANSNPKLNHDMNPKLNHDMNPTKSPDHETKSRNTSSAAAGVNPNHGLQPYGPFPMMPMQYPLAQCIPYPFPYMVPWLNMNPNIHLSSGKDTTTVNRNVFQPVPSRSFHPFHGHRLVNGNGNLQGGEETNGDGGSRAHSLTASQGSTFSAVSEYQSASIQGGSSSSNETRTDSINHASGEITQLCSVSKLDELPQKSPQNCSPDPSEALGQINVEQTVNELISNSKKSSPISNTISKAVLESKSDEATPPAKQNILTGNQTKPLIPALPEMALPEMPCVSTTGDGPNGKKITGFLYRYNKTEVSIVCVCHGTSFSPAEFIKHAGGREVSHPLRHIIVVPS